MTPAARAWLPAIALLLAPSALSPAGAAQYVIDGLALGSRVPTDSQNYRSYDCKPSDDFADLTWCQRSQRRSARGRNFTVSNTIAHAADGTSLYLMVNAAPVALNRSIIQNEIAQLSQEIGAQPAKVEWFPPDRRPGMPTSVIVYWGQIKLERLGGEDSGIVADGKSPRLGVLVDSLGDLARSAKEYDFPVYRMVGGPGYLYAASFDESGIGHRHYVAINGAQLSVRHYERALQATLQKDRNLASDDYQLWPEVAAMTRRLALDTSPRTANELLDKIFDRFPSKKLRSHIWSILPGGAIIHLAMHQHGTIDVYGPKTTHPAIRRTIERFLADKPSEPFAEFLHYTIGDYEKALAANPNSVIGDVLHYAVGYDKVGSLAKEAMKIVDPSKAGDYEDGIDSAIGSFNEYSERPDSKPITVLVPNFAARAAAIRPHFEAVLRNGSARHADDAAYMLGWLTLHQGKPRDALPYFGQATVLGNSDYQYPALRRVLQIQRQYSPREQVALVESDRNLVRQPVLWYVAARSAYREFDYALAIDAAQRALKALDVPLDRLPATTDPRTIESAIEKINPDLRHDYNMSEIPYLLEASREISRYLNTLSSAAAERPDALTKRARTIIIKYSRLIDVQEQSGQRGGSSELSHRDLRQALHMIDKTLESTPKTTQYTRLREWLHYRKVRVLVAFEHQKVPQTVTAMESEFPTSALMDDALAELIFVQGLLLKDTNAAQGTFRKLLANFPSGNAVDNGYTWMAIIYRCQKRVQDAQNMNREIIRRFAATRHAMHAQKRMANPASCGMYDP